MGYSIGVECEIAIPGKMEVYLSQNCRSHFEKLVENGCFLNQTVLGQSDYYTGYKS